MFTNKGLNCVSYGEVLFDVFNDVKKIGGAPLNVALRLNAFKNNVFIISKVGRDKKGDKLLTFMKEQGISIELIQTDDDYKTGKVDVMLNDKGSASYNIKFPRAWDFISYSTEMKMLVDEADVFIFGSLIARNEASKNTLLKLLETPTFKVFDINLREPYYEKSLLIALMNKADFIKFNDDELFIISKYLGSKYNSLEQNLKFVAEKTNTNQICVTKGKHGAVFFNQDILYYNSGYEIKVKDTVGAGDSFLASIIHKLLSGTAPQEAIDFACAVGALVAERTGANPEITEVQIQQFINPYMEQIT